MCLVCEATDITTAYIDKEKRNYLKFQTTVIARRGCRLKGGDNNNQDKTFRMGNFTNMPKIQFL